MTQFGAYYRAWFAERKLLSFTGSGDAAKVYLWTDTDERTRETGAALADGIMPGCHLEVHALHGSSQDELFHAIHKPDAVQSQMAVAALSGRIGDHPGALALAYRAPLDQMQRSLFQCKEARCEVAGKKSLLDVQATIEPGSGDHLADFKGPLATAATFAENLQFEYLEGMPDADLGWGKIDGTEVRSMMALHAASSDFVQRTPYIASLQGAHLLDTIERTLRQAESETSVSGAIGSTAHRVVFLVGHDTNITNVAAMLDAHWLIEGYQPDDAAPGGALIFELWRTPGKPDMVKVSYLVQTPDQMRLSTPLSLTEPPASAAIFLPGCSSPEKGYPCAWASFEASIQRAASKL